MKKALVIVLSTILLLATRAVSSVGMIPVLRLIPYPPVPDCVYYPMDYEGYKYPLRPGIRAWARLDSNMQMIAAVQIPEEILNDMSTKELAHSAACYPKLGDVMLFDSKKIGFELVFSNSNVLQVLAERDGAREELQAILTNENWLALDKYPWGYWSQNLKLLLQSEQFGGEGLPGVWWEESA